VPKITLPLATAGELITQLPLAFQRHFSLPVKASIA
jgi:hypothetical protein